MAKLRIAILLMAVALLLTGPALAEVKPLVIVAGLDVSGSYKARQQGIGQMCRLIEELKPGDTFIARLIGEASYSDTASMLFRLNIPRVTPKPKNKYDRDGLLKHRKSVQAVRTLKARAQYMLRNSRFPAARRTDVRSFFAACSDLLAAPEFAESRRLIVVASDLRDTRLRPGVKADLQGVSVCVIQYMSGDDPAFNRRLKQAWSTVILKTYQAESLAWKRPGMRFSLADMRGGE